MNELKMQYKDTRSTKDRMIETLKAQLLDLEVENEQLKKVKDLQLREKELLLKEIHHRVKNNMGTISNIFEIQTSMTTNKDLIYHLNQARNRINSMTVIYNMLFMSKSSTHLKTKEYTEKLLAELSDVSNPYVMISREIENFELDSKILFPIGIIINELVTNSFKHAFPNNKSGVVNVSMSKDDNNDNATLIISDNGVGKKSSSKDGFGSLLVDSLVNQLYATIEFTTSNSGTECVVCFPTKIPYSD